MLSHLMNSMTRTQTQESYLLGSGDAEEVPNGALSLKRSSLGDVWDLKEVNVSLSIKHGFLHSSGVIHRRISIA